MKKKAVWYVAGALILGLTLLAVSCGGGAPSSAVEEEESAVEEEETAAVEEEESAVEEEEAVVEEEEEAVVEEEEEETVTVTADPMAIPHALEGRDDCLMCHESGGLAVPDDHAGRTNETCTTCHKSAD